MRGPELWRRNGMVLWLFLAAAVLQGCSTLPSLVRHRDPLTANDHLRLGESYETQGLQEAALQQYQAAFKLQKNNIPALVAWGNLAFLRGDWKTAAQCYRRILRLEPTHAGANNNLAMVDLATGKDLDLAEQRAQMALKQGGPLRPYVLDTLATIYIQEGRYPEAKKALDDAVSVASPDNRPLRDQLAKTRAKLP
jgi:tetratricopeptide (TPR) repeat protein